MSNPRLDNFKIIDEQGMPHLRFIEHPVQPGRVDVWGSLDRRFWLLLETLF